MSRSKYSPVKHHQDSCLRLTACAIVIRKFIKYRLILEKKSRTYHLQPFTCKLILCSCTISCSIAMSHIILNDFLVLRVEHNCQPLPHQLNIYKSDSQPFLCQQSLLCCAAILNWSISFEFNFNLFIDLWNILLQVMTGKHSQKQNNAEKLYFLRKLPYEKI